MAGSNEKGIGSFIVERVMIAVETPVKVGYIILLFIGFLLLLFSAFVSNPCGNLPEDSITLRRATELQVGGIVSTPSPIAFGDFTVPSGTCGVVASIDDDSGEARVIFFAKERPSYIAEDYSVTISAILRQDPRNLVKTFFSQPPNGYLPFATVTPQPTTVLSNLSRAFLLKVLSIIFIIQLIMMVILLTISNLFFKKWNRDFTNHKLRTKYQLKLLQNRIEHEQLRIRWGSITAESDMYPEKEFSSIKQRRDEQLAILDKFDDLVKDTVYLIDSFESEDFIGKLRESDIENEDEILAVKKEIEQFKEKQRKEEEREVEEEYKKISAIKDKRFKKMIDEYQIALTWLGLVTYKENINRIWNY